MALDRGGAGQPVPYRPKLKKRKKKKAQLPGFHAPEIFKPEPKPEVVRLPPPAYSPHPTSIIDRNLEPMTQAYRDAHKGRNPTAQQAFALLTAVNTPLKYEEWMKHYSPRGTPNFADTTTNLIQRISLNYYGKTGYFPDSGTMKAQLQASHGIGGDISFEGMTPLFSPLVPIPSRTGIKIDKPFTNLAGEASDEEDRRTQLKWRSSELKTLPKGFTDADKVRQLANRPMHSTGKTWGEMDKTDRDNIDAARIWYGGTALKWRIENDWKPYPIFDKNGEVDDSIARHTAVAGNKDATDKLDPYSYISVKRRLFNKPQSELTESNITDLQAMAVLLKSVYGTQFDTWLHSVGGWKRMMYDKSFDKMARGYMIMANITDAYYFKDDTPRNSQRRKMAMTNLALATGGKIQAEGDVRQYILQLQSTGKQGDYNPMDEQYASQMFNYFYMTHPEYTVEEAVVAFAARYNPTELPRQLQPVYTSMQKNWDVWEKATGELRPGGALGGLWENLLSDAEEYARLKKAGLLREPIPDTFPEGVSGDVQEPLPPTISDVEAAESIKLHAAVQPYIDELKKRGLGAARGPLPGIVALNEDQYGILGNIVAPVANATVGLFDFAERTCARLWLTMKLLSTWSPDGKNKGYSYPLNIMQEPLNIAAQQVARLTGQEKQVRSINEVAPNSLYMNADPRAYGWSNIANAWTLAGERSRLEGQRGYQAFTDYTMEHIGLEPWGKDKFLAGVCYWEWTLLKDVVTLDPLTHVGLVGFKKAYLRTAEAFMSPAIKAGVKAAKAPVRTVRLQVAKDLIDGTFRNMGPVAKSVRAAMDADPLFIPHQYLTPELESALNVLREARAPLMWEPLSLAMSKNVYTRQQVARILGIEHPANMEKARLDQVNAWLDYIGNSVGDPDAIKNAFTKLTGPGYGYRIDPGVMFGRMRKLNGIMSGIDHAGARLTVPPTGLIEDGTHSPVKHFTAMWTLSNGGLRDQKTAFKRFNEYMDELFDIDDAVLETRYKKIQNLFLRMQDEIENNLREAHATAKEITWIKKYAAYNNVPDNQITSWESNALRDNALRGTKLPRRAAIVEPGAEVVAGTARRLVSVIGPDGKVTKVLKTVATAKRPLIEKEGVPYISRYDVYKLSQRLKKKPKYAIAYEDQLPIYDMFEKRNPFIAEQLANHLKVKFSAQDLFAYTNGTWKWDIMARTGWVKGWRGSSLMGQTNFFRLLAIGRLGFGFTAMGVDEIWRPIVEYLRGNITISRRGHKAAFQITDASGSLHNVDAQAFLSMMKDNRSSYMKLVPPVLADGSDNPDYLKWLNAYIAWYGQKKGSKGIQGVLEKVAKERADDLAKGNEWDEEYFRTRLWDDLESVIIGKPSELDDPIMAEARQSLGDELRNNLDDMNRSNGEWGDYNEILGEMQRLEDEMEQIENIREPLRERSHEIVRQTQNLERNIFSGGYITHPEQWDDPLKYVREKFPDANHPVRVAYTKWASNKTRNNWNKLKAEIEKPILARQRVLEERAVQLRAEVANLTYAKQVAPPEGYVAPTPKTEQVVPTPRVEIGVDETIRGNAERLGIDANHRFFKGVKFDPIGADRKSWTDEEWDSIQQAVKAEGGEMPPNVVSLTRARYAATSRKPYGSATRIDKNGAVSISEIGIKERSDFWSGMASVTTSKGTTQVSRVASSVPGLNPHAVTLSHEFGHARIEMLSKEERAFIKARFDTEDSLKPTLYSKESSREWMAENYALWRHGRDDLVDPEMKAFFEFKWNVPTPKAEGFVPGVRPSPGETFVGPNNHTLKINDAGTTIQWPVRKEEVSFDHAKTLRSRVFWFFSDEEVYNKTSASEARAMLRDVYTTFGLTNDDWEKTFQVAKKLHVMKNKRIDRMTKNELYNMLFYFERDEIGQRLYDIEYALGTDDFRASADRFIGKAAPKAEAAAPAAPQFVVPAKNSDISFRSSLSLHKMSWEELSVEQKRLESIEQELLSQNRMTGNIGQRLTTAKKALETNIKDFVRRGGAAPTPKAEAAAPAPLRTTEEISAELAKRENQLERLYAFQDSDAQFLEELNDLALPKITRREWREFISIRIRGVGNRGRPTKTFMLDWLRKNAEQPADISGLSIAERPFGPSEPRATKLWQRLRAAQTSSQLSVDDIRYIWDDLFTERQRKQFKNDWIMHVANRRGVGYKGEEFIALRQQRKELGDQIRTLSEEKDALWLQHRDVEHTLPKLSKQTEAWMGETVDRLATYALNDTLLAHLISGEPLTPKQLKQIRDKVTKRLGRLEDQGVPTGYGGAVAGPKQWRGVQATDLPSIVGVDPAAYGEELGYIPLFNEGIEGGPIAMPYGIGKTIRKLSEKPVIGKPIGVMGSLSPFTILDKMSDTIRQYMFLGNFDMEYNRLVSLGYKAGPGEEAERIASARAMEYTDAVQYSSNQTPLEHAMKPVVMFLPAYKQAALYWAKVAMRNPFLMYDIRRGVSNEKGYIQAWLGNYGMILPTPFWTQNNISEMMMPGVTAPFIITLRTINTALSWETDPEGGLRYTGKGPLDKLSMFPPLSFMGKGISPLNWLDDFLYAVSGDNKVLMPDHVSNAFTGGFATVVLALRKDPQARRKAYIAFANSMLSEGKKPDMDTVLHDIFGNGQWTRLFGALGFISHPEAFLSGASRLAFINRVVYEPKDVGEIVYPPGTEPSLLEQIIPGDDDVRSMADFNYEMAMAYGDTDKMTALFKKYPRGKIVYDYWNKNNKQKADFLSVPENRWVMAYVTGKNYYDKDGKALTSGEVYNNFKEGFVTKKNLEDYLDGFDRLSGNVAWDVKLRMLEADKLTRMKRAKDILLTAIKYAYPGISDKQAQEKKDNYLMSVKYHWQNRLVGDPFHGSEYIEPDWLTSWAGSEYGWEDSAQTTAKKGLEWSLLAINDNFTYACKYIVNQVNPNDTAETRRLNKLAQIETVPQRSGTPYYPSKTGVEGYYDNEIVYDKYGKLYTEGIGQLAEWSSAFTNLLPQGQSRLLDIKSSKQWHSIKKVMSDNKSYNEYAATKLASDQWWMADDAAREYQALGIEIGPLEPFRKLCFALEGAFLQFDRDREKYRDPKTGTLSSYDDGYLKLKDQYDSKVEGLLKSKLGEPFRNGPAGRLAHTYLVTQGSTPKNKSFISRSVKEMRQTDPDYEEIYHDRPVRGKGGDRQDAAHGWQAVLATAIDYRNKMKTVVNEHTGRVGVSAGTQQGAEYSWKLRQLAKLWSKKSPLFRRQWNDIGGDKLLTGSISFEPSMLDKTSF